jgi:hypothetical protein
MNETKSAFVSVLIKSSLRPSRLVRNQDATKGLSDYSHILHLSKSFKSSQHAANVAQIIFRMAIRFGLPESVALLLQDFGFVYDWSASEVDANREVLEKRNWSTQHILMLKAFIWRSRGPFSSDLDGIDTTPYVEYERAVHSLVALIPQGHVTPADVALVVKWAPMFAEYAVKAGPYSTRSFEATVRSAQAVSATLQDLNVPGFLNTIGTSQSFAFDESLIKRLKSNAVLKEAHTDLHIPRLNKALRIAGRTNWRKFVRNQTLWNGLHLDVFRGMTPDESIASMRAAGRESNNDSPFLHAAAISSRLTTSETVALLFNPYRGESSSRRHRRYLRPTRLSLWLLAELLKAQMRSKIGEIVFGQESPEALAYQFNSRKPVQDPAAAFAQILIDAPLPMGDAMLSDLVEMISPDILFESVEQCFIHPNNEVWDDRERTQIFGRTAHLLGKVALARPENGSRAVELLSKLRHALPDETLLSPQKRRIVQYQVKNALAAHALPANLSQNQLVDILTEHWMDLPARKQAFADLNIDAKRAKDLAHIGLEWQDNTRRKRAAGSN